MLAQAPKLRINKIHFTADNFCKFGLTTIEHTVSIIVNNITKNYGAQKALDSVSFEIGTGEIVGLLGPNGAGKSTMMKIITCFIPPTSGTVSVCGFDISEQSIDVRRNVGYLPEHNPLYLDMYVKEYLRFVASLHKVSGIKKRVSEMIDMVGLGLEQHKKIGALSKGYRQRVGLAQAMIHNPNVLILDEPTSGLDPNQLEDIRSLIKQIGRQKTVMLSTHIMQEVEAVCDRIVIVNRGKIVADNSAEKIQKDTGKETAVLVEFDQEVAHNKLMTITGVRDAKNVKENVWRITSKSNVDVRSDVFQFAVNNNISVLTMQKEEQSLEQAFKKLTNKSKEKQ